MEVMQRETKSELCTKQVNIHLIQTAYYSLTTFRGGCEMSSNKKITISGISIVVLLMTVSLITVAAQNDLRPEEQLGKSIFFDINLSINQNQSCAACQ